MKKQNRLMKTAIALWCIVAVGCKQSPVIQQSSGYATMTVSTSEKTLSNNYSASIRGKQDAPVVIDCQIDSDDKVFPMVAPGAAISDAFSQEDLDNK